LGESVEWAFSLAFSVFYDISAYFIVFLFRDLGLTGFKCTAVQ